MFGIINKKRAGQFLRLDEEHGEQACAVRFDGIRDLTQMYEIERRRGETPEQGRDRRAMEVMD